MQDIVDVYSDDEAAAMMHAQRTLLSQLRDEMSKLVDESGDPTGQARGDIDKIDEVLDLKAHIHEVRMGV